MKRYLLYIIGLIILMIGLTLKITLGHNMNYWGNVTAISRLIFILGLGLLCIVPISFLSKKKRFSDSKIDWLIHNGKKVLFIVLFLGVVFGLDWIGQKLNYTLRDYYLSNNTQKTIGVIRNIETINYVKVGSEKFYVIDLLIDNKTLTQGLMIKYADKDNDYFDRYKQTKLTGQTLTIYKLKGSQVEILYSERHPSFFKINE